MEALYVKQCEERQRELDKLLKQAEQQQYVEYVGTKLDDALLYQRQENKGHSNLTQLDQCVGDLVQLTGGLSQRFLNTIQLLEKNFETLSEKQRVFYSELQAKEKSDLQELEEGLKAIDRNFKERLRQVHKKA